MTRDWRLATGHHQRAHPIVSGTKGKAGSTGAGEDIWAALRRDCLAFCFRAGGGRSRNGGGRFLFLAAGAPDAGGFAPQIAEVVQAGASNSAFAYHFDGADRRRMQGTDALDAYTKTDATHGESGAAGSDLLPNPHAFQTLAAPFFLPPLSSREPRIPPFETE